MQQELLSIYHWVNSCNSDFISMDKDNYVKLTIICYSNCHTYKHSLIYSFTNYIARIIMLLCPQFNMQLNQMKHIECTIEGPHSSYAALLIQLLSTLDWEASKAPPIHTPYFLEGAAVTLALIVGKARAVISF